LKSERPDVSLLTLGQKGEHFKIKKVSPIATGLSVSAEILGEHYELCLPLVGAFQAMNALTALGLIYGFGIKFEKEKLIEILRNLASVPGRMDAVTGHPEGAGVYIDYAHTPDALETVLSSLRSHVQGRLVCVFGCGGNRDKGKRPLMGQITSKLADHVIVTDDNPRHENPEEIRSDILSAVPDAENIGDRKTAIQNAVSSLKSGDVLVIAGKGHEKGQIISGVTFPFDDKQEAQNAIALMQDRQE
jgi:UDP-N-acetylmuramoyl-L-alanyl-D-glutamate--2,6-diaminopimelate ligase